MDAKQLSFKGELRLLETREKRRQAVELWLLNGETTLNGGRYTKLAEHKDGFVNTPILTAYIGDQIGDGHNFDEIRDENGEVKASFMDAFAERVVGWFDADTENLRIEQKDGKEWIVGKGFILTWYARELTEKLRRQGAQGMSVSIETLVWNVKNENGVEVYEDYEILGTTILGDDVPPAVVGANIKVLQALGADKAKEITLKVASAKSAAKSEKGEITTVDDEKKKVDNEAEACEPETEACGEPEAETAAEAAAEEKAEECKNSEDIVDLKAKLDAEEKAKNAALEALAKMQKAERERRKNELKESLAVNRRELEEVIGVQISDETFGKVASDDAIAKYCSVESETGEYIGLDVAIKDLAFVIVSEKRKIVKIANNSRVTWGMLKGDVVKPDTDDFDRVMKEIN